MFETILRLSDFEQDQQIQLLLIFVVYHPSQAEVNNLRQSLSNLRSSVGYAVVVNDYRPGEPAEDLFQAAVYVVRETKNLGYGRAINLAFQRATELGIRPAWIGALNTDLTWQPKTFETLLTWLDRNSDVVLAVPKIIGKFGQEERLCKKDPTLLALMSRRFWPERIKPRWLKSYDDRYVMSGLDFNTVQDVPYLSGCCMLIKRQAFEQVRGFDERFFLYLEDADLTRTLRMLGRCIHLPVAAVCHQWGRGNHRSFRLTCVNLMSAWIYFKKWGVTFF